MSMTQPQPLSLSRRALPLLLGALALLAGCASAPQPVTLLALPNADVAEAPSSPVARPVLAVRRVVLPEYLLSRRVRYRADASTVVDWPSAAWAERLEVGMTRALMLSARRRLPAWQVCDVDCGPAAGAPAPQAVRVEFPLLDYRRDRRELAALARIVVESPAGSRTLERSWRLPATADSPQAQAELLGDLADRVAAEVAGLLLQP
jgi:uncharacterized lipoprotein YmbA